MVGEVKRKSKGDEKKTRQHTHAHTHTHTHTDRHQAKPHPEWMSLIDEQV